MKDDSEYSHTGEKRTKFVKAYDQFYNSQKVKGYKKKGDDDESCADFKGCEEGKVNQIHSSKNLKSLQ